MAELKNWQDVKVGDTVYFADEFAEPEPVVVEKIEPEEWDRYVMIYVSGDVFLGDTKRFRVVAPSHDRSLTIASRVKHEMLAGRLYTSIEAYKDVWNKSIAEQIAKLEKERADIDKRIDHLKKDIETIANIPVNGREERV